jgi:hypothetical protein
MSDREWAWELCQRVLRNATVACGLYRNASLLAE